MGVAAGIDITAEQRRTIQALLRRYLPGTAAWAYGSRVQWTSRPQSDLDLVVFATPRQHHQVSNLREAFEESTLPFRVDLFVWDDVPAPFRTRIEAEHVPLAHATRPSRPDGWVQRKLGEVIALKRGYDLPARDRRRGPVPVVSSSGITDHHSESRAPGPGVVTGRYGTLGQVFYVPHDFWPLNTALYVQDFKGNDPRFISYLLRSLDFSRFSDKAAVPGLNRNHLHEATVRVPGTVADQRAIAHILGTLDDKIELNRRMNATLEAMAQALFRSWFVDFDPVRAKMEGRDTGLPKELADLFPDRLVDSELGEIPEGWTIGTLEDIATLSRTAIDPRQVADDTPYIGLEHMPRGSLALADWGQAGSVSSTKTTFENRDILFGKLRPYFHKVGIAPLKGVCSTDIVVLRTRAPEWSAFTLASVSSAEFVSYASQTATGTRMPRTSWRTMSKFGMCLPADAVVATFQSPLLPMLDRIVANVRESRSLMRLRDSLLPPLVSGKWRATELDPAGERHGRLASLRTPGA